MNNLLVLSDVFFEFLSLILFAGVLGCNTELLFPLNLLFGILFIALLGWRAAICFPRPVIPGIPVPSFLSCFGVKVFCIDLVTMLVTIEAFDPLRLMGVPSVIGSWTLSGVDPVLTGLELLLSLTGLCCPPVFDKLLVCTAFIGWSLLDLEASLGFAKTGLQLSGLFSAALVEIFNLLPCCFRPDGFGGSFDFVNVSLRFEPGNEEVLDVDELELVRRLLLKPGALRALCDSTGIWKTIK